MSHLHGTTPTPLPGPPVVRVEIFKGEGIQPWKFRPIAGNGEPIAESEGYLTKWNATRAARRAFPGVAIWPKEKKRASWGTKRNRGGD